MAVKQMYQAKLKIKFRLKLIFPYVVRHWDNIRVAILPETVSMLGNGLLGTGKKTAKNSAYQHS